MKRNRMKKELIKEELTSRDIKEIKAMINTQLTKLFYNLYVKKMFWDK